MSHTLLLTGFEPYGGQSVNPACEVAERLAGAYAGGIEVVSARIPVVFDTLAETLETLLQRHRPFAVLSLGLYPGESVIRLEQLGVNRNQFDIPDNAGRTYQGLVECDGPPQRHSTLAMTQLCNVLLDAGIPARLSTSAGNFLCNALLYTLLGLAERTRFNPRCGFIHLPYLPEQVAEMLKSVAGRGISTYAGRGAPNVESQPPPPPSMSLDTSKRAVQLVIDTLTESAVRQVPDA